MTDSTLKMAQNIASEYTNKMKIQAELKFWKKHFF